MPSRMEARRRLCLGDDYRVIQFTPPGSPLGHLRQERHVGRAGSAQGLYLIVSDIAATARMLDRGVKVSEAFHDAGGVYAGPDEPYLFGRKRIVGRGSRASQLPLVRLVQRSRRQWLAVPANHEPAARTRGSATRALPRHLILQRRCAVRRSPMASTRSGTAVSTT